GELLLEAFRDDGIDVRLGSPVTSVEPGITVHLEDGTTLDGSHLLVATGRKPTVEGLGLETLGLTITRRGIAVDDRLSAGEHVWAIGDVTGIALFTHVGKYQGRIAAAN